MTPAEAVERYADVLQNGAKSQFADDFADDYCARTCRTSRRPCSRAWNATTDAGADVHRRSRTARCKIMRSTDGGDLVVAQINSDGRAPRATGANPCPPRTTSGAVRRRHGHEHDEGDVRERVALYVPPEIPGHRSRRSVRNASRSRSRRSDSARRFPVNPASVRGSTISRPLSDVACRCGNRPSHMATRPLCRWGTARFLAARSSKL